MVNAEADLSGSFNHVIEAGLKYISMVAKETEKHSQHLTAKFWRALLHKAYEILDKVRLGLVFREETSCGLIFPILSMCSMYSNNLHSHASERKILLYNI